MICKNCGSELIDGLLQCPYCGTEDTKEAVEQQKEYIEEHISWEQQNFGENSQQVIDLIEKENKPIGILGVSTGEDSTVTYEKVKNVLLKYSHKIVHMLDAEGIETE